MGTPAHTLKHFHNPLWHPLVFAGGPLSAGRVREEAHQAQEEELGPLGWGILGSHILKSGQEWQG